MRAGNTMIFFGLFWSAMTLLIDGFTIVPTVRQAFALRYPSTEGTVLSAEVAQHDSDEGYTYGVAMRYAYQVDGREYVGRRYRYQSGSSSDSGWAHAAVARHAPGSKTTVYYNPAHPGDALLAPGVNGVDLFLLAFMTPFNAVMLGFCAAGWTQLRRRWFKPVAGGVRIASHLRKTRIRLMTFSPMMTSITTVALMAFASIFIIGFSNGFHPSLRTMLVTWSVILTGGVAAWAWQWRQILTGKYDLILYELEGRLELPLTHGRKTREPIPLSNIQAAFVATVRKSSKDGEQSTPAYAPTLRIGTDEGVAEKLVEWYDAEKAAAFVEWLNEKLPVRESMPLGKKWPVKRVE